MLTFRTAKLYIEGVQESAKIFMKLAYRADRGYILMDATKKVRLDGLTADDARSLMFGTVKYDRRRSFSKAKNRQWADGIDWN